MRQLGAYHTGESERQRDHLALVGTFLGGFCVLAWFPAFAAIKSDISINVIFVGLMCFFLIRENRDIQRDKFANTIFNLLLCSLAGLFIWGVVSLYKAEDVYRSGRFFLTYGQGIALLLIIGTIARTDHLRSAFRAAVISFFLMAVFCSLAVFVPQIEALTYQGTDRLHGFFKNPNQFGMILDICLIFSVSFLLYTRKRLVPGFGVLITILIMTMTGSKTNLLIAVAVGLCLLFYYFLTHKKLAVLILVVPAVAVSLALFGLPLLEIFNPRAAGLLADFLSGQSVHTSSLNQRSFLWVYSLEHLMENPILGAGPGQRIVVYDQDLSHSHNVFLDAGRTLGVPGLIFTFAVIGFVILLALNSLLALSRAAGASEFDHALLVGAAFSVFSYILSNQMSDSFGPSTSPFFWLVTGLLVRRNDLMFFKSSQVGVTSPPGAIPQ